MSTDEYVPSEDDVRETWVAHESKCAWGPYPGDPTADFDRFLARVRRDAYDEGYERGMSDHCDADQPCDGPQAAESNPYRQEADR